MTSVTEKHEGKDDDAVLTIQNDGNQQRSAIDPEKEKKIIRKFDMFMMPQFVIIIILAYLDRSNIGNARIFGFDKDLGLKGNEFANLSSLFYVTYVIFEVPWVMALKAWGANMIIALAIIFWSAATIGQGFARNYHDALAGRLCLGFAEAGIIPAMTFVISTVYPRESQGKRIAVLYAGLAFSGAVGGLIAYGIQKMGARHGLEAWRWLFIIEGVISIAVGLLCWVSLPKSSENAWFLKPDEKQLIKEKRARDIAYTGDDEFSWKYVWMAFADPLVWAAAITGFCAGFPLFGFGIFLPTIIRGLGFNSTQVNALTIPVYVAACIILGTVTYLSDRIRKRAVVASIIPVIVMIGYSIVIGTPSVGAGFFAMILCSGLYTFNTILVAWLANNVKPDQKRAVAMPLAIAISNISGVAASQVYPDRTAPRFVMGNAVSLGMEFGALCGIGAMYLILVRRNKAKEHQRAQGIEDNGELGDKALDFEYIL